MHFSHIGDISNTVTSKLCHISLKVSNNLALNAKNGETVETIPVSVKKYSNF